MLNYISADWIFPVTSSPIKNGIVVVHPDGTIADILPADAATQQLPGTIQKLTGAIVPGFVNTHCHLELSHLLGKIPEHTGLMSFVQWIIRNRSGFTADEVQQAMEQADKALFDNGTVAVGDISNTDVSRAVKLSSRIKYHTFVEILGFDPARANAIWAAGDAVKKAFSPLPATVVPHAPYTVSSTLLQCIATADEPLISIHNQETTAENRFYTHGSGGVQELYAALGMDISYFEPTGKSSLQSYLPYMPKKKTLLVHNTFTDKDDIIFANQQQQELFWCLCPNANIYIENTLPDVQMLLESGVNITLGTDSLASNHQLNILAEMKTLQHHKKVDFETLLRWATWNGAEFLGMTDQLGSITPGKKPGLNLISLGKGHQITTGKVTRLI